MILNPWKALRKLREEYEDAIQRLTSEVEYIRNRLDWAYDGLDAHQNVLDSIIAQEKPTSNSTVKRMANIARTGKVI